MKGSTYMKKWYKGNLHCHTTNSDGKSSPQRVASYYKSLGYHFLGISDHNHLTKLEEYGDNLDENFIGIPCCEYSGARNCHVLALNVNNAVGPTDRNMGEWPKEKILQDGINKISHAHGIPVICHPSWEWTFTEKEIMLTKNCSFFEVCNAAPDCNSYPTPGLSANEQIWDKLLSANFRFKGIATDDAHLYHRNYDPRISIGGKGWIVVKSKNLVKKNILNAIINGCFYATTGIEILQYSVTKKQIRISIHPKGREKVTFEFFGNQGELLKQAFGESSEYTINGDENYIRIRMSSTSGTWAWTQPIFLDEIEKTIEWTND